MKPEQLEILIEEGEGTMLEYKEQHYGQTKHRRRTGQHRCG